MKKNNYLARIEQAERRGFLLGQRYTRQLTLDLNAIVLNREFGFGVDRVTRFAKAMIDLYGDYTDIWNDDSKDVEYAKATMDRALRQIYGDKLVPWEERYS